MIYDRDGHGMQTEQALAYLSPLCSALNYAHHQGVVHCDIKPANVLIDRGGHVLVSRFGIARMAEGTTMTMVGAGTPGYMSPEQVLGEAPTPRTDIYVLGVVLFELLAGGERLFTGERARTGASTSEKVRWEQVHLDPVPLRKFNPQVSHEVEGVVRCCLDKDPAARYSSTIELLNDIQQLVNVSEQAPVSTGDAVAVEASAITPPAPPEAAQRVTGVGGTRRGLWISVSGIILVTVAAGAILLGRGSSNSTPTPTAAQTVTVGVTDSAVGGLVETITAQAALLAVPTATTDKPPSDTQTVTASASQRATQPPADGPAVTRSAPSTTLAPSRATKSTVETATTAPDATPTWERTTFQCSEVGANPTCPSGMYADYCVPKDHYARMV